MRLESRPSGALVTVDGEPRGTTPAFLTVPIGSRRVEFALNGETRTLTVPVGGAEEAYQLVSLYPPGPPGEIQVDSVPAGALVTVGGEPRGRTPVTVGALPPGEHTVVVESPVARVQRVVEVLAGATVDLVLPLSGWVAVRAPFPVTVADQGRPLGNSQEGRLAVSAGTRHLTFANETLNFEDTREVEVQAGATAAVTITPPPGVINFSADAPAEVFLDGRPLGMAPLGNVQVTLGDHDVLFRGPQGIEVRYVIVVAVGPAYRLHAAMGAKQVRSSGGPPVRRRR
jgi:hypothetical protein